MAYSHGVIRRNRPPNPNRGQREYHGPCEGGCGQEIHTVGDPPRRLCVECLARADRVAMQLPEGQTCARCQHFGRCSWLIQCKPENRECDWHPSRFAAAERDEGGRAQP